MSNNSDKGTKNLNVPTLRFPEFEGEWEAFRNDSLFDTISEKNKKKEFTDVLSASQTEGMVLRNTLGIDIKFEEDSIKTYKIVRCGDYVIHLRSFQGGFAFSDVVGVCSPAYTILRPSEKLSYGFLRPYFMSQKFIDSLRIVIYGIRDGKSISTEEWLKLYTFVPTKQEQNKIITFIKLIDQRISTQNKIIESLESLIKGLYVQYFSKMESISKLDSVCTIQKGEQINGDELSELGEYYVMNGGILPSGYYHKFNTLGDTISISEGGNSCGYVQYNNKPFWSGGHCYSLLNISPSINVRYLYHFLKANEEKIMRLRIGSGLPNIQKKDLSRFDISIPPKNVQQQIVSFFDSITRKIEVEKNILSALQKQKGYLLQTMFI